MMRHYDVEVAAPLDIGAEVAGLDRSERPPLLHNLVEKYCLVVLLLHRLNGVGIGINSSTRVFRRS